MIFSLINKYLSFNFLRGGGLSSGGHWILEKLDRTLASLTAIATWLRDWQQTPTPLEWKKRRRCWWPWWTFSFNSYPIILICNFLHGLHIAEIPQVPRPLGCLHAFSKMRIYRQIVTHRVLPSIVILVVVGKAFSAKRTLPDYSRFQVPNFSAVRPASLLFFYQIQMYFFCYL